MWLLRVAWLPAAAVALAGPGDAGDAVVLLQQGQRPQAMRKLINGARRNFGLGKLRHRPVMWLTLPEAGGSTMCQLARANNETLMHSTDEQSCNWLPYDDFRTMPETRGPDCYNRQQTWLASSFSWTQIERPFREEDYCPDMFLYGTMLRHPVELARSLIGSYDWNSTQTGQDPASIMNCLEALKRVPRPACAATAFSPLPNATWKHLDNPMVRMLGGPEVWALPPGRVNTTHQEKAIQRLRDFDVSLVLEYFSQNTTKDWLRAAFGWSKLDPVVELHADRGSTGGWVPIKEFDILRIERINEHDMALYTTFKGLQDYNQGFMRDTILNHLADV